MAGLVFVIEDEKDIRESLMEAIESEGYLAMSASNGEDAILMFDERRKNTERMPDLILLDLLMPHMNGATFLEEARRDHRISRIPVILMSAGSCMAQKVAHLGADGHLHKPLELDDLFDTLEKHCKH